MNKKCSDTGNRFLRSEGTGRSVLRSTSWYIKNNKPTTKIRDKFNFSVTTTNGTLLNSLQYNGGVIQNDLFTIMINFRQHVYALFAEVQMIYGMINIDPSQRPLQRILWYDNFEEEPKIFELEIITYGTISAPYLTMKMLNKLLINEGNNFLMVATIIREKVYLYDMLCGALTLEKTKGIQRQLIEILHKAALYCELCDS